MLGLANIWFKLALFVTLFELLAVIGVIVSMLVFKSYVLTGNKAKAFVIGNVVLQVLIIICVLIGICTT